MGVSIDGIQEKIEKSGNQTTAIWSLSEYSYTAQNCRMKFYRTMLSITLRAFSSTRSTILRLCVGKVERRECE